MTIGFDGQNKGKTICCQLFPTENTELTCIFYLYCNGKVVKLV